MWILVAEAMGALALLLFIVWWTLGPTHRREREALERAARDAAGTRAERTLPAAPVGSGGPVEATGRTDGRTDGRKDS